MQVGLGAGLHACTRVFYLLKRSLSLSDTHLLTPPPTQVPSVDLNGLGSDLSCAEGAVDELSLVVQVRGMLVITWPRTRNARYVNFHLHCGRAGPVQGLAYCQGAG